MSLKPETKFKNRIRPLLNALPRTWLVKIQQTGIRGTPDFLMCVNGRFVAWELKRATNAKIDKLQEHNLVKIRFSGGLARLVSPENFDECYRELMDLATGGSLIG